MKTEIDDVGAEKVCGRQGRVEQGNPRSDYGPGHRGRNQRTQHGFDRMGSCCGEWSHGWCAVMN